MELDERVTVLSQTETEDQYGEPTVTTTAGTTLWANVQESSGSERLEQGRPEAQQSVTVTLRWQDADHEGIDRETMLEYRGDTLRVDTTREIGRRDFLECTTTRVR